MSDKIYTQVRARNALDAAFKLIESDPDIRLGSDDFAALGQVRGRAYGALSVADGFNRAEFGDALNGAANATLDDKTLFPCEYSDTIRRRSLIDLLVNAAGCLLDKPGMTLDEVMNASWQAEDPDEDAAGMVRGWLA